jgi:hypothetical protein
MPSSLSFPLLQLPAELLAHHQMAQPSQQAVA